MFCGLVILRSNRKERLDFTLVSFTLPHSPSPKSGPAKPHSGKPVAGAVIPPLAEQHRIVAKVDALMELCDALESRLKERAGVQARLAGAVVKQVAG